MVDKALILNSIKNHLNIKTDKEFAEYLGIRQNVLSNWRSRNTFDIEVLTQKCDFVNFDALFIREYYLYF